MDGQYLGGEETLNLLKGIKSDGVGIDSYVSIAVDGNKVAETSSVKSKTGCPVWDQSFVL